MVRKLRKLKYLLVDFGDLDVASRGEHVEELRSRGVQVEFSEGDAEFAASAGEVIVFLSNRDGGLRMYEVPVGGGEVSRVSDVRVDTESFLSWSPDGRRVLFAKEHESNIYMVAVDDGVAMQLTQSMGKDLNPSWSPDGSRIAFGSDRDGAGFEL